MALRLDVAGLVADQGGARRVAQIVGVSRSTPYRWIREGSIGFRLVEALLANDPRLDLREYLREVPAPDGTDFGAA